MFSKFTRQIKAFAFTAFAALSLSAGNANALVAPASPPADYVFSFSGNCQDCANALEAANYPVTGSLALFGYALGSNLSTAQGFSFQYGGSNLLSGFTINSGEGNGISGAFFSTGGPQAANVYIFSEFSGFNFSTDFSQNWYACGSNTQVCGPILNEDFGNNGVWNSGPAPVSLPGSLALLLAGFAVSFVRRQKSLV